jgi:hypothetical protein
MKNQNGSVIVAVMMILCLLTIIGVASVRVSTTELQISTNHQIYHMNFYAAESGLAVGPIWAASKDNYPESSWGDIPKDEEGNYAPIGGDGGTQSNHTAYEFFIYPMIGIDPSDGVEKVRRIGDANGDYLFEENFEVGRPIIKVQSEGTHQYRGGLAKVERIFIPQPTFPMPNAALRVFSSVNGNGVSGSIIGEHMAGSECADVADIMYDLVGGTIEYGGDLGDAPVIEKSTGVYPVALIEPIVKKRATEIIPGSNNLDEGYLNGLTSSENPGILYVDGAGIESKTTNLTGYGILFVNGSFNFAGNLDWHGIILVNGDITFSGGGTKKIYGSVVASGEAVAINGSVDIQYDCDLLMSLDDKFTDYTPTPSWRQL